MCLCGTVSSYAQVYKEIPAIRPDTIYQQQLRAYCAQRGSAIRNAGSLDSVAAIRCSYYLSLMTNQPGLRLRQLFDSIPTGKKAHERYFGKPGFFTESPFSVYTAPLIDLPEKKLVICAEIMQQNIVTIDTPVRLDPDTLIMLADRMLVKKFGPQHMLESYLLSPAHRAAIDKYGTYCYGTHTQALIRVMTIRKKFRYELLFFNSTLFARPPVKTPVKKNFRPRKSMAFFRIGKSLMNISPGNTSCSYSILLSKFRNGRTGMG